MPDPRPLLFDGAIGTYYAELCCGASAKCEMANLGDPAMVLRIHREYIAAGSNAIRTNTFGANTALLEHRFAEVEPVLTAGWRLAEEAAGERALIFADVGPIPGLPAEEAAREYRSIVDIFLACGALRFVFETFGEAEPVLEVARYIKKRSPGAFVLAQFAVSPDGYTGKGVAGRDIKLAMEEEPAIDAWGFNCVSGPTYLLEYLRSLGPSAKPMSAMPNGGYPMLSGGRTVYSNSPVYFAEKLEGFRELGVGILGGCCGTTPRHIDAASSRISRPSAAATRSHVVHRQETAAPMANPFWEKLRQGRKAIAAEVDPPADAAIGRMLDGASRLARAGADAITVADNPLARVRADSSMTASLISRRCGCVALPHIACRDRNLNAIKSLLIALHIDGVRNVLVVTGDPIAQADRGEVKGVYNSNSAMLAGYIQSLNETLFAGDPFTVGAALNINAPNLGAELVRAERKERSGVSFFLTQPVFSSEAVEALKRAKGMLGAKLLAGLLPVASHRNAVFLGNEVPGMGIPEDAAERFRGLDRAAGERLGLELALETAAGIKPLVDGYYVITPVNRYHMAEHLIREIRRGIDETDR